MKLNNRKILYKHKNPYLSSSSCLIGMLFEKTKPIYSYCVLRDAYCEKEFEKTKPILKQQNNVSSFIESVYEILFDLGAGKNKANSKPIFGQLKEYGYQYGGDGDADGRQQQFCDDFEQ